MSLFDWFFAPCIKEHDFNKIVSNPKFMSRLRELTLGPYSGMNTELDQWIERVNDRPVDVILFTAHKMGKIIGWAFLSGEATYYPFDYDLNGYQGRDKGLLFEIFVDPKYRRTGIGSALIKAAKNKIGEETMCICPWNEEGHSFYDRFKDYNYKKM